jgi:hypothetical protein
MMSILTTGPVEKSRNATTIFVKLLNNSQEDQNVEVIAYSLNGEKVEFFPAGSDTRFTTTLAPNSSTFVTYSLSGVLQFEIQIMRDSDQVAASVFTFDGNFDQIPSNTVLYGDLVPVKYSPKQRKESPLRPIRLRNRF